VDLAIGYFLPAALSHNPAFTVGPRILAPVVSHAYLSSARAHQQVHEDASYRHVSGIYDEYFVPHP
jgi:hypothetical protein